MLNRSGGELLATTRTSHKTGSCRASKAQPAGGTTRVGHCDPFDSNAQITHPIACLWAGPLRGQRLQGPADRCRSSVDATAGMLELYAAPKIGRDAYAEMAGDFTRNASAPILKDMLLRYRQNPPYPGSVLLRRPRQHAVHSWWFGGLVPAAGARSWA